MTGDQNFTQLWTYVKTVFVSSLFNVFVLPYCVLTTSWLWKQHWSEAESATICNTPQHNESKVEANKEIHTARLERWDQIWFGSSWSNRTSQKEIRCHPFIRGWADWQAEEWSTRNLSTLTIISWVDWRSEEKWSTRDLGVLIV